MTNRTFAALFCALALLAAPKSGFADVIQLVRKSDGSFVSNTVVRIDNNQGMNLEAFTDQRGRFTVNAPSGAYRATVVAADRPFTFDLQIDGQSRMKVYHLPF